MSETSIVSRARARSHARWRFIQYSGVVRKNVASRIARVHGESGFTLHQPLDPRAGNVKAPGERDRAHVERPEIELQEDLAGVRGVLHQCHVAPFQW